MGAALIATIARSSNADDHAYDCVIRRFPERVRTMRGDERRSGSVRVTSWSHPASRTRGIVADDRTSSWLTLLGNPVRDDIAGIDGVVLLEQLLQECICSGIDTLRSMSPPFAVVFYDGRDCRLHVLVDRVGVQHLYLREDTHRVWISSSSRALGGADVDPEGVAELLAGGMFSTSRTLYSNVRKLAGGDHVTVTEHGSVRVAGWKPSFVAEGSVSPPAFVALLTRELRAGYDAEGTAIELSGGIDSRLTLAGFHQLGLPFRAWTFGHEASADVQTVRTLHNFAKFPHVLVTVDAEIADRLPADTIILADLMEGELNALGNAPLLYAFETLQDIRRTTISGAGGEVHRGFYYRALRYPGPKLRGVPVNGLKAMLLRGGGSYAHALVRRELLPNPDDFVTSLVADFIRTSPATTPAGILDDFYLRGRMQRYGKIMTTTGLFARQALPFLANDLVDLTLPYPRAAKQGSRLARQALAQMSLRLASIPLDSGLSAREPSWRLPHVYGRDAVVWARRAALKFGGDHARRLFPPRPLIPWKSLLRTQPLRDFVGDLMLSPRRAVDVVLDPEETRRFVEDALAVDDSTRLGMLVSLELALSPAK